MSKPQISYTGVTFYAEVTRKGSRTLTGTILAIRHDVKNGTCVLGVGRPADGRPALPVTTWVYPEYLANRCYEISEQEARVIDPKTFHTLDAHHRSPEYRLGYSIEVKKPGKTGGLQPALPKDYPADVDATGNVTKKFYEIYGH